MPGAEDMLDALVDAMSTLSGWRRSAHPPAMWYADGVTLDGRTWSVDVVDTEITGPRGRTTTAGVDGNAVKARTTFVVRWVSRIRGDAPHTSYAEAIAERTAVLTAIGAAVVTGLGPVAPRRVAFDVSPGQLAQLVVQRVELTWDHAQPI